MEDDSVNLFDRIVAGWDRSETNNGVFYYVNHKTEQTNWDHPYLTKIMEELQDFNYIQYAAYRTSLKLRHLQKRMNMHMVQLETLDQVFVDKGYSIGGSDTIACQELLSVLTDMYMTTPDRRLLHDKADIYAELLLNLLISLMDVVKSGILSVLSVKVILCTLCKARLAEKYKYFYQQLHNPSTYITKEKLAVFLEDMIQLPELLHESAAFGRDVDPVIASCQQLTRNMAGISEDVFLCWLFKEPQTLVWLPTLHRVAATESVKHEAKCNVCKAYPIVGFRYRCLKCFNFDICQKCFFMGKTRKNHKSKHPMQEYCHPTSSKDDTKAFVTTIRNNLSRKQEDRSKAKYLPIDASHQFTSIEVQIRNPPQIPVVTTQLSAKDEEPCKADSNNPIVRQLEVKKSPVCDMSLSQQRKELESVIKQLEEENRLLYLHLAEMKHIPDTEQLTAYADKENLPTKTDVHLVGKNGSPGGKTNGVSNSQQSSRGPPAYHSPSPVPPLGLSLFHNRISPVGHTSSDSSSLLQPLRLNLSHSSISPVSHTSSGSSSQSPGYGKPLPTLPVTPGYNPASMDSINYADISPSHLSLPSFSKTNVFTDEEIELQQLNKHLDNIFPVTPSYSLSQTPDEQDEMLQAASDIGVAMTDFVSEAVHPYYHA